MNKKYENLTIYLIGPMEDDKLAEILFNKYQRAFENSGVKEVINPCVQEKEKTGFNVSEGQVNISTMRMSGQNSLVDKIYRKIWEADAENVRRADILVAHIEPGDRYTGTSVEATLGNILTFMDVTMKNLPEDLQKEYKEKVRPWIRKAGWSIPVYLITSTKTRINGTFVHTLVRGSKGRCFKSVKCLIKHLKKVYN